MSGAQVALTNLGVPIEAYFSSEINKHSIKVTQDRFPNTIQLGDINTLSGSLGHIDLVVFGSPCTDLSIAKKNRESLAGKSSGLFYRAVEVLKSVNPKYFLMENVASMSDESKKEISRILGVSSIEINSKDFTSQNRRRLYWFNWSQPASYTSTNIPFRDRLLPITQVLDLQLSQKGRDYMGRKTQDGRNHWDFGHHSDTDKPHSACVVSNFKKGVPYNVLLDRRVYQPYKPNASNLWPLMRSFHPIECERLQGFPDDYTKGVANTHRYEMIGNAFTVPVIERLLRSII
jgi:DNA (cytosine-5)-methyltransferase 3A